jgi:integrase/recombinase XerD
LRKIFKDSELPPWPIIEKELIDEIIFKTTNPRNCIMLELMARGGMRVGEVLKIRPIDIQDRKITLPEPKSGKESEVVFIPQKVADRLKDYIKEKGIEPDQRISPIMLLGYRNIQLLDCYKCSANQTKMGFPIV